MLDNKTTNTFLNSSFDNASLKLSFVFATFLIVPSPSLGSGVTCKLVTCSKIDGSTSFNVDLYACLSAAIRLSTSASSPKLNSISLIKNSASCPKIGSALSAFFKTRILSCGVSLALTSSPAPNLIKLRASA